MTVGEVGIAYRNPPVTEIVAAVAFRPLVEPAAALLGSFWATRLRNEFPLLEQKPPYIPPIETFTDGASDFQFPLQLGLPMQGSRLWATSEDKELLLQLQADWFACNWRRLGGSSPYRHWEQRREWFVRWFTEFTEFIAESDLGEVMPTQCEVTYINHPALPGENPEWADAWELIDLAPGQGEPRGMGWEQVLLDLKFLFPSVDEPLGRLHAKVSPAFDMQSGNRVYALELTARGAPQTSDIEGVMAFLDAGRAAVDQAFEYLTTETARQSWGRGDVG